MNTVSTLIEIRDNMSTLDSYLTSSDSVESNYAKNLIGRGFCYVADNSDGMYRFYPSRFIGYANNSMKNHVNNDTKSGFETNPIISKVIKYNPEKSDTLDKEFNNYCKYLNIIPKKNQRKYWDISSNHVQFESNFHNTYEKHISLLDEYIKNELTSVIKAANEANQFVKRFITRFSRESIKAMAINDFLYKPDDYVSESSFCRQLMYSPLASMGNCFPSIFGLYLKGGTELKLSKTYAQYGINYENAFDDIKSEIVDLLNAGDEYDYDAIERSRLNSAFKNILLAVYHNDKFLPAPTHTALDAYCEAIGLVFPSETTMAYRNHSLVEWKESVSECKEWDNFILMRFCDWLWRSGKKINGKSLTESRLKKRVNEIIDELNDLDLKGETREAVVKVRVNQSEFRDRLLGRYNHCCLCGVSNASLLIASHIKPWSVSETDEKLDVDNGLLLCPNHDQLFDQGFISFNDNGNILISPLLEPNDRIFLNVNDSMKIDLTNKNIKYMKYHRDSIFKK